MVPVPAAARCGVAPSCHLGWPIFLTWILAGEGSPVSLIPRPMLIYVHPRSDASRHSAATTCHHPHIALKTQAPICISFEPDGERTPSPSRSKGRKARRPSVSTPWRVAAGRWPAVGFWEGGGRRGESTAKEDEDFKAGFEDLQGESEESDSELRDGEGDDIVEIKPFTANRTSSNGIGLPARATLLSVRICTFCSWLM
jgi:hypothetical protein